MYVCMYVCMYDSLMEKYTSNIVPLGLVKLGKLLSQKV